MVGACGRVIRSLQRPTPPSELLKLLDFAKQSIQPLLSCPIGAHIV